MNERPWVLRQLEPFIHTQRVPADDVTIRHGKGKLFPPVTLVRDDGEPIETLIDSIDENSIVVKLNQAVCFTAYIY